MRRTPGVPESSAHVLVLKGFHVLFNQRDNRDRAERDRKQAAEMNGTAPSSGAEVLPRGPSRPMVTILTWSPLTRGERPR
jgi:hypothetical protein